MESDLQQHCGIDLRDLWRFDESGRRRLTLRRLGVLLRHLPPKAATNIALGGNGWDLSDYLIADNYHATAGVAHPARPVAEARIDPERGKREAAFKKRAAERQRQIDAGEIT